MKIEFEVIITDKLGLHARPAATLSGAACKFESKITACYNKKTANVKSVLNMLSLAVPAQTKLVITCDGKDAEQAKAGILKTLKKTKLI